jgi:hypothetical protein
VRRIPRACRFCAIAHYAAGGFWEEESDEHEIDPRENGEEAKDPPPAGILDKQAAYDWAERRGNVRAGLSAHIERKGGMVCTQ